jgi:hypothetical protein
MSAAEAVSAVELVRRAPQDRPLRAWAPALVLLGAFLVVTTWAAARLPFWRDEMYTVGTTGSGLLHAYRQAIHFEQQPPFYYLVLSLWRLALPSLFEARLFSVLSATAALAVLALAARRAWPTVSPAWTVLVAGTAPLVLWAAAELRVYAFLLFLVSLLFLCYHEAFLRESPRRGWAAAYVGVGLAALYSHYYAALFIAACAVAGLVLGRTRALRRLAVATVAIGIGALPALAWIPAQMHAISPVEIRDTATPAGVAARRALDDVEEVAIPAAQAIRHFFPVKTPRTVLLHWLVRLAILAACGIALVAAFRRPWPAASRLLWPTVVLGTVAIEFVVLRVHFGPEALYPRYLAAVALVFPLVAAGAAALWRPAYVLFPFVAALNLAALAQSEVLVTKVGDLARVGAYLTAHAAPNETIMVLPGADVPPLRLYFHGSSGIEAVPCPVAEYGCLVEAGDSLVAAAQLRAAVARGGAWVVINPVVRWQRLLTEAMVREIDRHYRLAELRTFRGNGTVRHVLPR